MTPNLQLAIWLLCGCVSAAVFVLMIPEKTANQPQTVLLAVVLGPLVLIPLALGLVWITIKFARFWMLDRLVKFLVRKRDEARARIDAREARAKEAARQAENTN